MNGFGSLTQPRTWSLGLAVVLVAVLLGHGVTEEVPVGSLEGNVIMERNGRGLPKANIVLKAVDEETPDGRQRPRVMTTDEDGRFRVRNLRAGTYWMEVSGKAHRLERTLITVAEGPPTVLELEAKANEPHLTLYASQRVFTPNEQPKVEVHGFVEAPELQIDIYRLRIDGVASEGGLSHVAYSFAEQSNLLKLDALAESKFTLSHAISQRDGEGTFIEKLELPPLEQGLYWVDCRVGGLRRGTYLNVTRIAMVAKMSGDDLLCYVIDIESGQPVVDAELRVSKQGALESGIRTDSRGIARVTVGEQRDSRLVAVASRGPSSAMVSFWHGDDKGDGKGRIYMVTDRPIYRPGDDVQFKGICRRLDGSDYSLPPSGDAEIEIRDDDNTLIQKMTVPMSGKGTFHGSFPTSREAGPGSYQIHARAAGVQVRHGVTLAAYRKPEFTVAVRSVRPQFVLGEKARVEIACQYYFGGPVAGAQVSAYVFRLPDYRWWGGFGDEEDYEEYADYEDSWTGEMVERVEAVTNAEGIAVVEFPTERSKNAFAESDYIYTVDAWVSEEDSYFEGRGKVKVVRGEFDLRVAPDRFLVNRGEPIDVTVTAISHDGQRPVAGQDVEVQSGSEQWVGNEAVFRPKQTFKVRTDAEGQARVSLPPSDSYVVIRAIAEDSRRRSIVSQASAYVIGGSGREGGRSFLTMALDRTDYGIGDEARLLVQTDRPGGHALLTIEADQIYETRVVPLKENETYIPVTIRREFAPNAYVTVAYVKDKRYREASRRIKVDLGIKRMRVEVEPDRTEARPGESVRYRITTRDHAGQPVPAELSLAVVDESVFAIREDRGDIVSGFYPKRWNNVSTDFSFPELYLDGGDKGGDVPTRRDFRDTALWLPTVQTDVLGRAEVEVVLPDNLTSWRTTVVGATDRTEVGQARTSVRASKPLMVRLLTPSYLVGRDEVEVAAVLTNRSGRDQNVNFELRAEGVGLQGRPRQTVRIAKDGSTTLRWKLRPSVGGTAILTARAIGLGDAADAVERRIDILPHGRLVVESDAGEIDGISAAEFQVRPSADPNFGGLKIVLSPSVASAMVQSLDDLIGFPYGCVEQTMSRFLPTVLVSQAVREAGLPTPAQAAEVPLMVADGFARLRAMQHWNGGWGWWDGELEVDPTMSALVLDGLYRAERAGFAPSRHMVDRGLEWAVERVNSTDAMPPRPVAYLAYVLALHGKRDASAKALQRLGDGPLGTSTLAFEALARHRLGAGHEALRDRALDRLVAKAIGSGKAAHWPKQTDEAWGNEPTAIALHALLETRPDHPLVPKAMAHLMRSRQGSMWGSTRATSYVLLALTDYLRRHPPAEAGEAVELWVNGALESTLRLGRAADPSLTVEIPMGRLRNGTNRVEFRGPGSGSVYYSAELRQSVVSDQLARLVNGSGLNVGREYRLMAPRRMEDGTIRFRPSPQPVQSVRSGQVVQCEIVVETKERREFLMIEDPVPSNLQVMASSDSIVHDWNSIWSRMIVRDDRVAFFVRELPAGRHVFRYTMRAENPGVASALPGVVYNMYEPEVRGSGSATRIEVRP
jgi:alpha-2-macroglobulin